MAMNLRGNLVSKANSFDIAAIHRSKAPTTFKIETDVPWRFSPPQTESDQYGFYLYEGVILVDWGDGEEEVFYAETGTPVFCVHTYPAIGEYTINIRGKAYFTFSDADITNLIEFSAFGDTEFLDFENMFGGAYLCDFTFTDQPDLSRCTSMKLAFAACSMLDSSLLNHRFDLWDTSNITDMSQLFRDAIAFNEDISAWNVSSVTDMGQMFERASDFNNGGVSLSAWNTSSVTTMERMFNECSVFNQDIDGWNVSSVTDMNQMFRSAINFNRSLNSWDVSSVTNMGLMFYYSNNFNQPLNLWNVSSVTDMNQMFGSAVFNQDLTGWNVSNVTDCSNFGYSSDLSPSYYPNFTSCTT